MQRWTSSSYVFTTYRKRNYQAQILLHQKTNYLHLAQDFHQTVLEFDLLGAIETGPQIDKTQLPIQSVCNKLRF